jgi:glycosyltransferase involved in cell wall biosynthesis
MRICIYTHTALPLVGGQETVVDALAREFTRLGHHTVVLAPRPTRFRRLGDHDLPYRVARHPRFISKHLVGWYRWWLLRLHRRHGFDAVHAHGIYPAGYLAGLCRERMRRPLVFTSHGEDVGVGRHLSNPKMHARHVQALEHADALVAISGYTSAGYRKLCPQAAAKIVEIPNGVHVDDYAARVPRPEALDGAIRPGEYLLFLGRLDARKGAHVLLDALALVPGDPRVRLVVAGDGRERAGLEAQAARLGLHDRVRFVGMVRDRMKVYLLQNARCVVVPSIGWEGQPMVVLEAFAAGRPVVASDLAGFAGLVKPGENGWIVRQAAPADLARVLSRVLVDDAELNRAGARALQTAQACSWPAIAQRHLRLYEQLLADRRLRRCS